MVFTTSLRLVLCRLSPYKCVWELIDNTFMQSHTKLFNGWITFTVENHWFIVIWNLTLWFGVDPKHITPWPYFFHQFLNIPLFANRCNKDYVKRTATTGLVSNTDLQIKTYPVLTAEWDIIWHCVQYIHLFNSNRINLIKQVEDRDVSSVVLYNVNELVNCNIFS